MKNLTIPNRFSENDLKQIISEKRQPHKPTLLNKTDFLIQKYSEFQRVIDSERISPVTIPKDEAEAFLSLYNSKTHTAQEVCNFILSSYETLLIGDCLYCGIGKSDELDHFLPKESFPYYSILEKNLIPICSKCNKIKGEEIPGFQKDYIHIYYDILPKIEYLKCKISISKNIPIVDFQINFLQSDSITERISKHYEALNLFKRFKSEASQYILRLKSLKLKYGDKSVFDKISSDLLNTEEFYGINHWKFPVCKELLSSGISLNLL